ncbi:hypothetical protein PVN32_28340, partial [Bacillus paralicheniformis]
QIVSFRYTFRFNGPSENVDMTGLKRENALGGIRTPGRRGTGNLLRNPVRIYLRKPYAHLFSITVRHF